MQGFNDVVFAYMPTSLEPVPSFRVWKARFHEELLLTFLVDTSAVRPDRGIDLSTIPFIHQHRVSANLYCTVNSTRVSSLIMNVLAFLFYCAGG